jgi:polysaccharide export outer membrane protein
MRVETVWLCCLALWASAAWSADAPQEQPAAKSVVAAPKDAPAPAAPGTGPDYVIGPGDTIQVFVWRNPELTVSLPVRPDGKISSPLVEDMVAVGKTSSQLARDIEKVLSEYVRSPQVNVIVTVPVSTFSQIRVIGEVKKPGSIPYRDGLTVLDAILQVGGITDFAAGNRAKIIRKSSEPGRGEKSTEIKVHLEALLRKGKIAENVTLQPGDVLVVPASLF